MAIKYRSTVTVHYTMYGLFMYRRKRNFTFFPSRKIGVWLRSLVNSDRILMLSKSKCETEMM